jgi:hypothetical protein
LLEDAFVSERTANIGRNHADLSMIDSQALRQHRANHVRHLGRRNHDQLCLGMIPVRQHRLDVAREFRIP